MQKCWLQKTQQTYVKSLASWETTVILCKSQFATGN